tara:strand:+ start:9653 stop:10156 length:504 start_codon:yes stop_codon:yes gene_type:complete
MADFRRLFDDPMFLNLMRNAFRSFRLPPDSVGRSQIKSKSIEANHCNLNGNWNFTGNVQIPKSAIGSLNPFLVQVRRVFDNHVLNSSPIIIASAAKKNICINLPEAISKKNYIYIVKRSDSNEQFTCELMASANDTIDDVTSVSIPARGCLVCVSSGFGWHILANYS